MIDGNCVWCGSYMPNKYGMCTNCHRFPPSPSYTCPQCGCTCKYLVEGYCRVCQEQNQQELDLHNAEYDQWNKLSETEKNRRIKNATSH